MGLYIKYTKDGHRSTHPSATRLTQDYSQTQTLWDTYISWRERKEASRCLISWPVLQSRGKKLSPELLSQQRVTNEPWALKPGREHLTRGARARPRQSGPAGGGGGGVAVPSLPRGGPREEMTGFAKRGLCSPRSLSTRPPAGFLLGGGLGSGSRRAVAWAEGKR